MAKCLKCNKKAKISRKCPALNMDICSTCCGTKRGNEIKCDEDCTYFISGIINENKKSIMKLVKESFNDEHSDLYQDIRALKVVDPFERFLFNNFYNSPNINDDALTDCFLKAYYSLEGKGNIYTYSNDELEIINRFNKIAEDTSTPIELQKTILLRLMKSVDNMTGGMFGNKMFLELLRGMYTRTGITAPMFEE